MGRKSREKRARREAPSSPEVPERQGRASGTPPQNGETRWTRRRVLACLAAAVGGTAAIGTAAWVGSGDKDDDTDNPDKQEKPKSQKPEADVDALAEEAIQKAEEAMVRLEAIMRPYLNTLPKDEFREQLEMPFEQMRINYDNPNKNAPRSHRRMAAQGQERVKQENPSWFSIKGKNTPGLCAGFGPLERIMQISTDFDPNSMVDMLVLYHELRHVSQDTSSRMNLMTQQQFEAYVDFHSGKTKEEASRFLVTDEASAYAYQIEMLNLYLNDWLQQASVSEIPISIDEIVQKLNGRPEQRGEMSIMLQLAYYYFPERMTSGNFSRRFLDEITTLYEAKGYQAYIHVREGGVKRYKVGEK